MKTTEVALAHVVAASPIVHDEVAYFSSAYPQVFKQNEVSFKIGAASIADTNWKTSQSLEATLKQFGIDTKSRLPSLATSEQAEEAVRASCHIANTHSMIAVAAPDDNVPEIISHQNVIGWAAVHYKAIGTYWQQVRRAYNGEPTIEAVLSGIGVRSTERRRGIGSALLYLLIRRMDLEERLVALCPTVCDAEQATLEDIGFEPEAKIMSTFLVEDQCLEVHRDSTSDIQGLRNNLITRQNWLANIN